MDHSRYEKVLSFFSPKLALKRKMNRYMFENSRKFEGASLAPRVSGWQTVTPTINEDLEGAMSSLRARSIHLYKNSAWARKAILTIVAETVRTGCLITPASRTVDKTKIKKIENIWNAWSSGVHCDHKKRKNIYSIQSLVFKTVVEVGECLILRKFVTPTRENKGGLCLKVLGPEFLDHTFSEKLEKGNQIVGGIEFNGDEEIVKYHLFKENPNGFTSYNNERVEIEASEVIHIFREEYPEQIRGIPWLAPVLIKLRDFDEYEDAQLMKQKVSSLFAGFIYEAGGEFSGSEFDKKSEMELEPGLLKRLQPGEDIKFGAPPSVDGYSEYSKQVLHAIAAGMGMPYIALTSDLSQTNYSSFRGSWLEFQRSIDIWRQTIIIDQISNGIFNWFLDSLEAVGVDTSDVYPVHTPAKREMIDPTREIPAKIQAIRSGIMSWSEIQRSQGKTPEDTAEELSKDFELFDKFSLTLDSDPRKVTGAGIAQLDDERRLYMKNKRGEYEYAH